MKNSWNGFLYQNALHSFEMLSELVCVISNNVINTKQVLEQLNKNKKSTIIMKLNTINFNKHESQMRVLEPDKAPTSWNRIQYN